MTLGWWLCDTTPCLISPAQIVMLHLRAPQDGTELHYNSSVTTIKSQFIYYSIQEHFSLLNFNPLSIQNTHHIKILPRCTVWLPWCHSPPPCLGSDCHLTHSLQAISLGNTFFFMASFKCPVFLVILIPLMIINSLVQTRHSVFSTFI